MQGHGKPPSGLTREQLESLVDEGLTIEMIAQHFGVADSTAKKWLKRHGLKTQAAKRLSALAVVRQTGQREIELECGRHGLTRFVVVGSMPRLRCAKCRSEAVARRRRRVKEILIVEAGGKCLLCGYARHSGTLQFHHLDPAAKSFGLGERGLTRSIEKSRAEAAKCVLLCANCHAEVEAGLVELPVKSRKPETIRGVDSD
jgi:transposase-like protein